MDNYSCHPLLYNTAIPADTAQIKQLIADGKVWQTHDRMEPLLRDLIKTRHFGNQLSELDYLDEIACILNGRLMHDYGYWVYYPWSGQLVHMLPPDEFSELRLDRNRNKITAEEQCVLERIVVGIVGLSVGNAIALTLALEGVCGHFKLADFDTLDLSNMNRIRASVNEIGLPKTVLAARQISETNPYARFTLFHEGLTETNIHAFMQGTPNDPTNPPLDIVIDECDSMDMKVRLREFARKWHLPVLMETSDRGMLDIERFDLEPNRSLFHGIAGDLNAEMLKGMTAEERMPVIMGIVGAKDISVRMAMSIPEIRHSISTWPQLASDVVLGGASATIAVRALALGQPMPSGRRYIDLEDRVLGNK